MNEDSIDNLIDRLSDRSVILGRLRMRNDVLRMLRRFEDDALRRRENTQIETDAYFIYNAQVNMVHDIILKVQDME